MARFTLHGRVHLRSDKTVTTSRFVRCGEDARWAPAEKCRRCPMCEGIDDRTVTCTPAGDVSPSVDPELAPIAEVMDTDVLCVDANATVESVRNKMVEVSAPIAIVVDARHHAIGVCAPSDLTHRARSRRVETCMTPFVLTMLDRTTVADLLELVLERDLKHVPVLSEGRVVGLVTPRAVIRWLAQKLRVARNAGASAAGVQQDGPANALARKLL